LQQLCFTIQNVMCNVSLVCELVDVSPGGLGIAFV